jgi:porin
MKPSVQQAAFDTLGPCARSNSAFSQPRRNRFVSAKQAPRFWHLPGALTLALAAAGFDAAGAQTTGEQSIRVQDTLTGDWGGARTALANKGVTIGAMYFGETFGVLSGGVQQGTAYEGLFDLVVDADLQRLLGWDGATMQVRGFQINNGGRNSTQLVGGLGDVSSINALPTTRLFTAWLQQEFGQYASLQVGQLAADQEFLVSHTAYGLINGTFGWPIVMSANLPSGGPAYPLGTPGVRFKANPTDTISLLGAVFSGNPAGANCQGEPQACDLYGTAFSFTGGAFLIGEAQYQVNRGDDRGLAAAYKIGAWYHNGEFADQQFGVGPAGSVVPLATAPAADPLNHSGDWGVYAVVDQMLWRSDNRNASVFFRAGFSPSDRNLVSWYVDGGLGLKGLLSDRPNDVLSFGFAYSKISNDAAAFDRDAINLNGTPFPVRIAEAVFEVSYIAQLAPWWTVQPDVQYIVHPGGNVPNPDNPTQPIGNAFLMGVRTTVSF